MYVFPWAGLTFPPLAVYDCLACLTMFDFITFPPRGSHEFDIFKPIPRRGFFNFGLDFFFSTWDFLQWSSFHCFCLNVSVWIVSVTCYSSTRCSVYDTGTCGRFLRPDGCYWDFQRKSLSWPSPHLRRGGGGFFFFFRIWNRNSPPDGVCKLVVGHACGMPRFMFVYRAKQS